MPVSKEYVAKLVEEELAETPMFLVELEITSANRILIELDSPTGVKIDDCVRLSRAVESHLDRDAEDFELQVSSAGLDRPLRDRRQFEKNIGKDVRLKLQNGKVIQGVLLGADQEVEVQIPADKKQKLPLRMERFGWEEILETKVVISF